MAQAQYDKFIELRKSGVDALTARKQAYGDIPTAPTVTPAPVTPTPTGGATLPIAPEVTPTQPVPPPVAPTPVQPAPVTQTPTPPTPAPTTPAPIVDKNAEIKAQNEATMAENKQQAELRQAERDKVTQDANNALASNEGAILNTLKTGGIIPDSVKTSPYYKSAQQTYNKLQQFSTYSIGELTTALDNGSILPGTSVYNELLKDPAMKQKLTEAQSYTTGVPSIPQSETVTQEIIANNPTTASYLADGVITQDEWDNATNNAEVVAKAKDVEAKTNKYNQLYAEYEAIEGEVKSQFPGSPFADSIIADRQKAKYKNVLLAKGEMDTANGTLTELKSNAANLFETNLKLYQDQQKQANEYKMADYQAKLGMQKSVFDANLGIKTKQAEFEQGLAQQAEMAKDPTTAIGGILSQFQKLGITSDMDVAGHLASFQASGLSLPEYTKQMIENFKKKPEYTQAMARKNAEGTSYQTFGDKVYKMNPDGTLTETDIKIESKNTQDWAKLDDTTLYNQRTGELKKVSASEASGYGPSTTEVTPDAIKGMSSRLSGNNVQCGMVSNDYMAQKFPQAPRMGDSYESKVKSVEAIGVSDVPQVGGVFAMNTYNSNGHTGIVQSVDLAKGTFTATDANRAGSKDGGPVTTSTYKISDNLTFSKAPAGAGTIRPSDIDYFNSATATDKKKLSSNPQYVDFNNKKSAVMGDPNADIYEVMQYSQGGKDMGEERLKSLGKFSQGLSQVAELSKKVQETTTGPIIGRIRSYNPYDANAQALLAEINSVIPNIARGVYGEVGVLTDADIQNYAKTLPNIKSTEDTNKLVLAMTLKTMLNGFKGQIQIDGSAGRDVSGFVGTVKQYEDRINQLLSQLGGTTSPASNSNYNFQSDWENL